MATETLAVTLLLQANQYKREAREAATATGKISDQAKTAATSTGLLERKAVNLGGVLRGAAVTGGILALGRGLFSAVETAERAGQVLAVTEQVIKTTGGAANVTAVEVAEMTRRMEGLTGVEGELIQEGANILLTFKNLRNEVGAGNDIFDRATKVMLDVSTVMGGDATGAATQLGKALNDPITGMTALRRAGLTFTEQQQDQIKALVASGDLLSAQKLILSELETQVGGTAEAAATASDKIGHAFGEIAEAIGAKALPFVESFATELQKITGQITELDRVAALSGGAADSVEALFTAVVELTGGAGALNKAGQPIQAFFETLVGKGDRLREEIEEMVAVLSPEELSRALEGVSLLDEQFGLTAGEAELLREAIQRALGSSEIEAVFGATRGSFQNFAGVLETTGDAAADAGGELGDVTDDIEESGEAAQSAAEKTRDLRNAYLELADPIFAANSALGRYLEAQVNLSEAQADGESTARDIADAQLDVAAAALEAEGALSELADGDINAGIATIAEALDISDEAARDLLETLGILDGMNVTSTVTTEFRTRGTSPTVGLRQHGGPVSAFRPYVVGEAGPELFIPSQSGTIIPNTGTTASPVSGLSSGPTYIFNGDVYGDEGFMRKVREANVQNGRLGLN